MTTILTSIHGIRLGLDKDGYLTGPVGIKMPEMYVGTSGSEVLVNDNTTTSATVATTATAISNSGITTLTSTAAKTYTMTDPTGVGLKKRLVQTSSSTAGLKITPVAATIAGSTLNVALNLFGAGNSFNLESISTAVWAVLGTNGSVTVTTA